MELITEFEFELPRGYVDENGEVHKKGVMSDDHSSFQSGHFLRNIDQHPADHH